MQVPVRKELWDKTNGNVGVWSRERFTAGPGKENGGLCPTKSPLNSSEGFGKAFLKARWGEHPRVDSRFQHSSLTGWWWAILRYQKVWGPCAQDHQAAHFFHLVVAFSIWKRLWDTVIWVLQTRATAEDTVEGSVPGRFQGVPLSYRHPMSPVSCFSCCCWL